jgi:hypothetical protein
MQKNVGKCCPVPQEKKQPGTRGKSLSFFPPQMAAYSVNIRIIRMLKITEEVFSDAIPVSLRDDFSTLIDLSLADFKIRPIV